MKFNLIFFYSRAVFVSFFFNKKKSECSEMKWKIIFHEDPKKVEYKNIHGNKLIFDNVNK